MLLLPLNERGLKRIGVFKINCILIILYYNAVNSDIYIYNIN